MSGERERELLVHDFVYVLGFIYDVESWSPTITTTTTAQ